MSHLFVLRDHCLLAFSLPLFRDVSGIKGNANGNHGHKCKAVAEGQAKRGKHISPQLWVHLNRSLGRVSAKNAGDPTWRTKERENERSDGRSAPFLPNDWLRGSTGYDGRHWSYWRRNGRRRGNPQSWRRSGHGDLLLATGTLNGVACPCFVAGDVLGTMRTREFQVAHRIRAEPSAMR